MKKVIDSSFIYILLYVDDMLVDGSSLTDIERDIVELKSEFDMKDLG